MKHVVVTRGDTMEHVSTGSTVRFVPPFRASEPDTWHETMASVSIYIAVDGSHHEVVELFEDMASQWRTFLIEEGLFEVRPEPPEDEG